MAMSPEQLNDLIRRLGEMAERLDPDGTARAAAEREAWRLLGEPGTDAQRALADDYRRAAKQARDYLDMPTDDDDDDDERKN